MIRLVRHIKVSEGFPRDVLSFSYLGDGGPQVAVNTHKLHARLLLNLIQEPLQRRHSVRRGLIQENVALRLIGIMANNHQEHELCFEEYLSGNLYRSEDSDIVRCGSLIV